MIIASRNLTLRDGNEVIAIPIRIYAPELEKVVHGHAGMKSTGLTKNGK